ncbi:MAG TPA: ATP-binding protein [Streptosporangiaceae bacterium]|nr:ATP-binding protein [Streptosporangiaceae bacterium]
MTTELARFELRDAAGVFAARQLGREVAAELGLDRQNQVRVATAISEIGRDVVVAGQTATIVFATDSRALHVTITHESPLSGTGVTAAARLMDTLGTTGADVRLTKRRPAGARVDLGAARRRLAAMFPASALDELRRNNEDLIAALDDLQRQQEQLIAVNSELEETNRGVMALHKQLSDELEQTNQGVVALYAELDDKSERLREASEAKTRFWASVSHELRTPLNSIVGLTRLLLEDAADASRHELELILNSANTLVTLVNDLLDVAKAESGRLQVEPVTVSLPALLSRVHALLGPMTEGKPVEVVVEAGQGPDTVLTDEVALTAILRNLLSNGIKYTDRGSVRLTARTAGPDVEISVADTGIGINPRLLTEVFEEFYQAPGVRRGGTGLGLPYARRLAELLGGELTLASEPGAGTTVTLRLPHEMPVVGSVLIADDDAAYRQVLRGMLPGLADHVVEAADGAQALAALEAGDIGLVLADLRMPGTDGFALLESMPTAVPAIVITAMNPSEPPQRASAVLRKDELTKERLAFAIRRALRDVR